MKNSFLQVATTPKSPKWHDCLKRQNPIYERENDIRGAFERDYTRLLHCRAYRRLKHKTQVFFATTNDHICTRMEHVGHVCSVSATIARYLGLNEQLTSAIAIGHDIGHAPFGHHGEDCLNGLLKQKEGQNAPKRFWHEKNSLFFADFIETLPDPKGAEETLNLTYAVRDGIICHCGEVDKAGITPREKPIDLYSIKAPGVTEPFTWEGCVVKVADKIAFLGRDIEDARTFHILDMASYRQLREAVAETLGFDMIGKKTINTTVLINDLITDLCKNSSPAKGLCFSDGYFKFIQALKEFSYSNIYRHWRLLEFQHYASLIIQTIYRTLCRTQNYAISGRMAYCLKDYPALVSTFEDWLIKYSNYCPYHDQERKKTLHYLTPAFFDIKDETSYKKCIIEYISGMTDNFAIKAYNEIITF